MCRYQCMSTPKIGVIAAPDVAEALAAFGFEIVTGSDHRAAATEISQTMTAGGLFPMIVADRADTAPLRHWVTSMSDRTRVVVLGVADGVGMLEGRPERLALPVTLNDVFRTIGYATTDRTEGSARVMPDATVALSPEPPTVPDDIPLPDAAVDIPIPVFGEPEPRPVIAADPVADDGFPDELFVTSAQPSVIAEVTSEQGDPVEDAVPDFVPAATPAIPVTIPQTVPQAIPEFDDEFPQPASVREPVVPIIDPVAPAAPPIASVPVAPAPVSFAPDEDEEFFSRRAARTQQAPAPRTTRVTDDDGRLAPVIFTASGRGGVGKSTTAIKLAHLAAGAGMRAVLIDANRGQADLRKYLRIGQAGNAPTILDAAFGGSLQDALMMPEQHTPYRQQSRLEPLDFGVVLGPPPETDISVVNAALYSRTIEEARRMADLVVVDTQIIETPLSDIWSGMVVPLLRGGAWMLGLADSSSPGISNLYDRLNEMVGSGIAPSRLMIAASMYAESDDDSDRAFFERRFDRLGAFVGFTAFDQAYKDGSNLGRVVPSPTVDTLCRTVLQRVTGRHDLFGDGGNPQPAKRRFRLFGGR